MKFFILLISLTVTVGKTRSLMFALLRRYLSDRLGVLLHGGWRRRRHADLHLAVVFRWEEAETLPILRKQRRQTDTSGGTTKGRGLRL